MVMYKAIIKFKSGVVGNIYIPAENIATAVLRLEDIFENSNVQEFDIKEHLAE